MAMKRPKKFIVKKTPRKASPKKSPQKKVLPQEEKPREEPRIFTSVGQPVQAPLQEAMKGEGEVPRVLADISENGAQEQISQDDTKQEVIVPTPVQEISSQTVPLINTDSEQPISPETAPDNTSLEQTVSEPVPEAAVNEGTRDQPPKKSRNFVMMIIIFILFFSLGGGLVYLFQFYDIKITKKQNISSVAPTPQQEKESEKSKATPTPQTINRLEYKMRVLNGSGIKGEAARIKDILTEEGFDIISVGNAQKSDYTDTVIQAKKEVKNTFLEELIATLQKSNRIATPESSLEKEAQEDILIIVGSEKSPM